MGCYRIDWKQTARKELRRLDKPDMARVLAAVEGLADQPRPTGCRKLAGTEKHYRIRVGAVRVIYSILEDLLVVEVIRVGHRGSVYRR
jgi:mRNA interferase RelE/StbE